MRLGRAHLGGAGFGEPLLVCFLRVPFDLGKRFVSRRRHQFVGRVSSLGALTHAALFETVQAAAVWKSRFLHSPRKIVAETFF